MAVVEELHCASEVGAWRQRWAQLVASQHGDVFQTFDWISTWLRAFWADRPIAFLTLTEGGSLVGLAPFLVDSRGELWCRGSHVLPIHGHVRRTDFVYGGLPAREMLDAILSHLTTTRPRVRLSMLVRNESDTYAVLPQVAAQNGLTAYVRPENVSPWLRIETDWESFLSSKSRHFRRGIRQKAKAIESAGRVSHSIQTDPASVTQTISDILIIESRSWKARRAQFISGDPRLIAFYNELAHMAARNGWLRVHLLYLDSTPVAFVFGLVHDGRYYALKTSFDDRYAELSPGIVLFTNAIRDAFDQGLQAFEFLGEDSRWKHQWSTDFDQHSYICVVSGVRPRCAACHLYHARLKPAIKRRLPTTALVSKAFRERRIELARTVRSFFGKDGG